MTQPPRDPKARDRRTRAEHIQNAQDVIADARDKLRDMDRREAERATRRDEEK